MQVCLASLPARGRAWHLPPPRAARTHLGVRRPPRAFSPPVARALTLASPFAEDRPRPRAFHGFGLRGPGPQGGGALQGSETKEDLVALQDSLPGPPGYWDPLELTGSTILAQWGLKTPEENIGWWRHAEINGRVAMAGFLGFCAQRTPLVSGEHTFSRTAATTGVTPQEQWDNNILLAKMQIFIAIGMLESYGEGAPRGLRPYTKGGQPATTPTSRAAAGQITSTDSPTSASAPSPPRRPAASSPSSSTAALPCGPLRPPLRVVRPRLRALPLHDRGFPHYSGNVMIPFGTTSPRLSARALGARPELEHEHAAIAARAVAPNRRPAARARQPDPRI